MTPESTGLYLHTGRWLCCTIALIVLATQPVWAHKLIITNARLFTASNSEVIEGANIIVVGKRIHQISTAFVDTAGADIIDATGKMVLPGLIDVHVHNFFDFPSLSEATPNAEVYFPKSESEARAYIQTGLKAKLEAYLNHGFTSILSPIDFWPLILEVRDQLSSGDLKGPRLFAAGGVFTSSGSHPICKTERWCAEHLSVQISGADEARHWVRRYAESGVSLITYDDISNPPNLGRDVIKAMIDEAHQHNLGVFITASHASDISDFVALGVDGFLHPPQGPRSSNGLLLVDAGARQLPVAITIGAVEEKYRLFRATQRELQDYRDRRQNVMTLLAHGAVPVFGSDLGDKRGITPQDVIRIATSAMTGVGLTREQVLHAATRNAARAVLGQKDIGTLEPGKLADILIVDGDPLMDLEDLLNVVIVIKGGKIVVDNR